MFLFLYVCADIRQLTLVFHSDTSIAVENADIVKAAMWPGSQVTASEFNSQLPDVAIMSKVQVVGLLPLLRTAFLAAGFGDSPA